MAYRKNPLAQDQLRRMAKERLNDQVRNTSVDALPPTTAELLEELEIHQIELELQNEHLNQARAQLEKALNQSNELYDFAPVGFLSLDNTGSITKLNLASASLLGLERVRLLGRRLALYVAPHHIGMFNVLMDQAKAQGGVQGFELTLARDLGPTPHVQISLAPLPQAAGWQVVMVDVSERYKVEEQLREADARWKLSLDAVGDGVWDWDISAGSVERSERFCAITGFTNAEYGNRLEDWSTRIHPDDRERVLAHVQRYLAGGDEPYASEHRELCRDGSWKWVLSRGAVIGRAADGKPLRMVGTHVDLTALKRAQSS